MNHVHGNRAVDFYCECIKRIEPAATHYAKIYIYKNFDDHIFSICGDILTLEIFIKVTEWACRQKEFLPCFIGERADWKFTNNWSKIMYEFNQAHAKPQMVKGNGERKVRVPFKHLSEEDWQKYVVEPGKKLGFGDLTEMKGSRRDLSKWEDEEITQFMLEEVLAAYKKNCIEPHQNYIAALGEFKENDKKVVKMKIVKDEIIFSIMFAISFLN